MNWYNYVGSDPVNFVDPTGLAADSIDEIVVTAKKVSQDSGRDGWGGIIVVTGRPREFGGGGGGGGGAS